jgi:hypothetical protein
MGRSLAPNAFANAVCCQRRRFRVKRLSAVRNARLNRVSISFIMAQAIAPGSRFCGGSFAARGAAGCRADHAA